MRHRLSILIVACVLAEVLARMCGLGTTLLYEKMSYGYRVAPNQAISRLGKATYYNDLGLRNDVVAVLPSANTLRILCIGDSITFGGTLTDQALTYPYQLQRLLADGQADPTRKVEVLNASAGGWSLENEEGWINQHGLLGAQWVVLQVATHDLFQRRTGPDSLGRHPSFPDRQPLFALEEAVTRYLWPWISKGVRDPGEQIVERVPADVHRALVILERMVAQVRAAHAAPVLLLVEQPADREPADNLTRWAKQRLIERMSELRVPLVRPGPAMDREGGSRLFRDGLHPNAEGNQVLAREVARAVAQALAAGTASQRLSTRDIANEGGAR